MSVQDAATHGSDDAKPASLKLTCQFAAKLHFAVVVGRGLGLRVGRCHSLAGSTSSMIRHR